MTQSATILLVIFHCCLYSIACGLLFYFVRHNQDNTFINLYLTGNILLGLTVTANSTPCSHLIFPRLMKYYRSFLREERSDIQTDCSGFCSLKEICNFPSHIHAALLVWTKGKLLMKRSSGLCINVYAEYLRRKYCSGVSYPQYVSPGNCAQKTVVWSRHDTFTKHPHYTHDNDFFTNIIISSQAIQYLHYILFYLNVSLCVSQIHRQ